MTGYAPLDGEEAALVRKLLQRHRKSLTKTLADPVWAVIGPKTRERLHGEIDLCHQIERKLR